MNKSIALLILIFCFAASLHAQRSSGGTAPPPVVAQSVTVRAGETVVVQLGIHGVRGERLEFSIRSQPKSGRLSEVRAVGVNAAQVSYTAPLKGSEEDRFTYAVRNRDGVSAPGIVSITIPVIPAQPAKLSAPETIDLPKVFPGQRATADLEIRNTGGTHIKGDASVPAPWSIEGEKHYRIGPGERVTMKVAFAGEKTGTFKADLALGPEQRRNVALKCEVEEALVVSQTGLSLASAPGEKARRSVLQVNNRSEEEVAVNVMAGERLIVGKSFSVPARGMVDVPIAANAAVPSAFDEQVIFQSKGWRAEIPVHVEALKIVAEASPPPAPPAPIAEKLPPPVAPVANVPLAQEPEVIEPSEKEVPPAAPARIQKMAVDFPKLSKSFARVTSPTSAVIEWPSEFAPAKGLRFQERVLSLDDADALKVTWNNLSSVDIRESAGLLRVEFYDLAPEQPYTLRAVRGEETVFTVQFSTPRKKPFINIEARTACLILLFPFLGWLAWRKWKTRAQSGW